MNWLDRNDNDLKIKFKKNNVKIGFWGTGSIIN